MCRKSIGRGRTPDVPTVGLGSTGLDSEKSFQVKFVSVSLHLLSVASVTFPHLGGGSFMSPGDSTLTVTKTGGPLYIETLRNSTQSIEASEGY